mmetsp:Transcript_25158/g.70314  ORF Transcript_25158/g.70314 Transcript_25158/m.70314 type:complete len:180 (-) Transcript_25158:62-601(-)
MRVDGLQPEASVSILDTDVEAEVAPSIENEAEVLAAEEAARRKIDAEAEEVLRQQAEAALEAARQEAAERELERVREEKAASLPPEPEPSSGEGSPLTTCMVRLPDGQRRSRRFRMADSADVLFHWVDSLKGSGVAPGSYRLVAQHPRRVLQPADLSGCDMQAAGLNVGQEALFLEPLQ